ncbi:D-glycero-beta-D-manno-heptose 1-phosphate adenylyltransferase [Arthrobacter sp. NPDC080031]|uniref:D-glycero-beta-D-manno-heptose 1-phosphate adenylyltransferase n=1 Tax=Arthrobacter sp. NPDC080031 TaxID=3155918 RepID=UPI00344ED031
MNAIDTFDAGVFRRIAGRRSLDPRLPQDIAACRPHVVVLGELILDGWWSGSIDRLCREAPVPVFDVLSREYSPGGGANTAVNLAALGAKVSLLGLIGDDDDGRLLRRLLTEAGVGTHGVITVPGLRTQSKTRLSSEDQLLLRYDDGARRRAGTTETLLLGQAQGEMVAVAREVLPDSRAVVVCDYGQELLPLGLASELRSWAPQNPLFVVDAHDASRWAPLEPDLVTPNAAEAARLAGRDVETDRRVDWAREVAPIILSRTRSRNVVVTLDREGTVLVESAGAAEGRAQAHRTWAHPVPNKQASGGGDTFVAALTVAAASGLPLRLSADLAQVAADVAVHRPGTAVCSLGDLSDRLSDIPGKVVDPGTLLREVSVARAHGLRIVLTNGVFDVLHRGHTSYLEQAKELGDVLVVAVNGDESTRRLKGEGRPVNRLEDRTALLASLRCVDYITVFHSDTPIPLIEALRPDVYAKGGDYQAGSLEEAPVVERCGGRVVILDYVPDYSTSAVVRRIKSRR